MVKTSNRDPSIRIIVTGGTLDKHYNPLDGSLGFRQSQVPALLETGRAAIAITCLMQIDSLDMTIDHRKQVLTYCEQCSEQSLVITHGTDTMVETAAVLADAKLDATIVLTGAMVPASIVGSDASFNLGFALASAQALAPGVWVAMNGAARPWNDVRKDRERGVFTASRTSSSRD